MKDIKEDLDAIRCFVWTHRVSVYEDGKREEQMVCRFDSMHEKDRAHINRMIIGRAKDGIGWKWAVFAKPGMRERVAEGEEVFLADAMSACEETFYMTRDVYQERFEREYMGNDEACRIYGRF
jgi:hypothetical protein